MYIEKIKERKNVENENVFTIEQMNLVLHDILGAGSETVHASILWAILYLIHYPDIQERLQQYVDKIIPVTRMPCLDDKANLPYVDAFIAEVLRCANIVPLGLPRAEIDGTELH